MKKSRGAGEREGGRTIIGVGAREPARARCCSEASAKTESRKDVAEQIAASEGSDAAIELSRSECVLQSRRFWPSERKMTSSASWVRPRWVLEPRMVCDCSSSC
jgi:hypothetical protein